LLEARTAVAAHLIQRVEKGRNALVYRFHLRGNHAELEECMKTVRKWIKSALSDITKLWKRGPESLRFLHADEGNERGLQHVVRRVGVELFKEMRYLHVTNCGPVPSSIRIVGGCAAS
jgi:hypothetical protein